MSEQLLERAKQCALPFAESLGVVFTEASPDRVVATLHVRADLCTLGDVAHGGALMAMADSVGAIATILTLPSGATATTTIESKTNFVGTARAGSTLVAVATPVHRGRRTQVWQTRIEADEGRLVAIVMQTQLVL
jgi:1,4-dihydroxy-2-naphthoyl-CoA hydrolase